MKDKIILTALVMVAVAVFALSAGFSDAAEQKVCCEKTVNSLLCQEVGESQCAAGSRKSPTACASTDFCRLGTCYDSIEGTCIDNTPKIACNAAGGVWNKTSPPQCSLGCCILGDQAAFVSLVRCKRLSGLSGLQTNYRKDVTDEVQCVNLVRNQDKGACVYESEFVKTCKFTTRAECSGGVNGTSLKGQFFKDKLCSAEELGTNCAPTSKTTCVSGKDEVYFIDSCGNPANIFDASKAPAYDSQKKIRNLGGIKDYWTNAKRKEQSCNPSALSGNAESSTCGNCNYLAGSYCRASNKRTGPENICADLNCKSIGKKHGESWCASADKGISDSNGKKPVGSRYFKNICVNGEVIVEACDDFRQQECIQDAIQTSAGPFSQAACKVNRWRDCIAQDNEPDCLNSDKRDCTWNPGLSAGNSTNGACLPLVSPGLKFWEGEEARAACSLGNAACVVQFEKGLFGGKECKSGCECLKSDWVSDRQNICMALGDCGPGINWIGERGYKQGFSVTEEKKSD